MKRTIKCRNEDGVEVTFGSAFTPFLLERCDGIYSVENDVALSENPMTDGATMQGAKTKIRNIVLYLCDHPKSDHKENRQLLYSLFKPNAMGTLFYREKPDAEEYAISYTPETILPDGDGNCRKFTVSLLCPDPFFTAPNEISVTIAGWQPKFRFPHRFPANGEPIGIRVNEKLKTILNTSAADNIGIAIRITAFGNVVNPSIYHVEQGEHITVGTSGKPFAMSMGDMVTITTGIENKHVYLLRNGECVESNAYLSEESEFLQLNRGANTFGYLAQSGSENMAVTISYRYRYLGV